MAKQYSLCVYNAKKAFAYTFPLFVLVIFLFLYTGASIHSFAFSIISFIIICLIPFIFEKRIKRFFTKNALIEFNARFFSLQLRHIKDNTIIKETKYNWNDIKAYKFYFTPSRLTYMDIYFKKGGWKEFGFKDNKTEEESINGESIFSIFRDYVKQYNSDKEQNEKIILKPGFLTTSSGTFFMVCIAILILTAITFILFKNPRSFPFLIMSIFIFIPLLVKRSQDKKLYEKMSKLD